MVSQLGRIIAKRKMPLIAKVMGAVLLQFRKGLFYAQIYFCFGSCFG